MELCRTPEPRDLGGSHTHNRRADGAKCNNNVSPIALSHGHDVHSEQRTVQVNGKGKATLSSHDKKSSQLKGRKSLKRPNLAKSPSHPRIVPTQ